MKNFKNVQNRENMLSMTKTSKLFCIFLSLEIDIEIVFFSYQLASVTLPVTQKNVWFYYRAQQ